MPIPVAEFVAAAAVAIANGHLPASNLKQSQTSNALNPQMSVVGDFRIVASDSGDEPEKADFREVEIGLAADVDPYLRAEAYIALHNEDGETRAEIEEAFGTYTRFGKNMSLKVGKIAAAVGRTNRNHQDQLNYLDYPMVIQDTLGEEGMRAGGVSFSYLFPGERFNEFTLELLDPSEGPMFADSTTQRSAWVAHYRTFFDFSEDVSAQLGLTYLNGPNGTDRSTLYGADYTMKWSPGQQGRSMTLETEAYWSDAGTPGSDQTFGAFAALTYEVAPRWFVTGKYDYSELPGTTDNRRGWSAGVTHKITEFHHWRAELRQSTSNFEPKRTTFNLQLQFALGPHPAHKY